MTRSEAIDLAVRRTIRPGGIIWLTRSGQQWVQWFFYDVVDAIRAEFVVICREAEVV